MTGLHQESAAGISSKVRGVSVLICAFTDDRRRELKQAIASVRSQSLSPLEIIVIVDHNSGLLEWLRTEEPGLRIAPNVLTKGLSGSRNTGIKLARGDVIAFLDDDAVADRYWLSRLSNHYLDDRVGGVGGRVLPLWQSPPPKWFPAEFNWTIGCSYQGQPETVAEIRNPFGCNMSFRREFLLQLGGFREDPDWRKAGQKHAWSRILDPARRLRPSATT
jgi:glycosyltransferase involved in cell wall biosynthesis